MLDRPHITLDRLALPESSTSYVMAIIPIAGSTTRFYTVEARDLAGYDSQLPARAVIIHKVDTTLSASEAQVVDVDRNRNPNDPAAMWLPGETFSDLTNGISVSILAPAGAGFQVTIASSPPATAALAVVRAGGGNGTVTSTPAGIDCGTDCTESYSPLTSVRLHAAAGSGSVFTGWGGGGCSGVSDCTITLTSGLTVTATFQPAAAVAPDLIVTGLANPPPTAVGGGRFRASDTVENRGDGAAPASRMRYYLSANAVRDGADVLLTGTRTVKSLPAGARASGSTTVTVPSATPPGTYLLLACTDDLGVVGERDETNNCMAAATSMIVQVPDLAAIAVSDPPGSATRNARFAVTDSVENQGSASAAASRVRYSLSRDGAPDTGDTMLGGIRAIAKLAAGAISSGTVTVTVPSSTAAGSYYLLACADAMGAVSELIETNNCHRSASRVVISP